jgi:hypothetical protein
MIQYVNRYSGTMLANLLFMIASGDVALAGFGLELDFDTHEFDNFGGARHNTTATVEQARDGNPDFLQHYGLLGKVRLEIARAAFVGRNRGVTTKVISSTRAPELDGKLLQLDLESICLGLRDMEVEKRMPERRPNE